LTQPPTIAPSAASPGRLMVPAPVVNARL